MSTFITPDDYDASIHAEILDSITRSDANVVTLAEEVAIEEAKGYLASRYDVDEIFNKTGNNRSKVVLMMCIDMVLYHLHSANNPMRFPEIRKQRYERAIKWLEDVQKGVINPHGLPLKTNDDDTTGSQTIFYGSNPRRTTIF